MNVYDFDGTIYNGDSSIDFFMWCLYRHKRIILKIPKIITYYILYKLNVISKIKAKEVFFEFLQQIDDIDMEIEKFWEKHIKKIKNWYKITSQKNDLIISASPLFLLQPIMEYLEADYLIASKVNKLTGKFESSNCYGQEKVKRFYEQFGNSTISNFYSDSFSDKPMAMLAKNAYYVKGNKIENWNL